MSNHGQYGRTDPEQPTLPNEPGQHDAVCVKPVRRLSTFGTR